jgi:hypothetical protein
MGCHVILGDISVVAALGDFVVAGTGSLASKIPDAGREFRGVSFATGKDERHETCCQTLPVAFVEAKQIKKGLFAVKQANEKVVLNLARP